MNNVFSPEESSAKQFAAVGRVLSGYSVAMDEQNFMRRRVRQVGAVLIALFQIFLVVLTVMVPSSYVTAHNILHHLNFLPLMFSGMIFGARGAAWSALFAAAINAPVVARHWVEWPMDAKDQILELSIFSIAGLIAGFLSDRERAQRTKLEKTRQELENVYLELRASIEQMKKAERLSAAGQLAASLAHEIRNPLASISGAAGILQRGSAPPEYLQESLDILQKESQRLNKLLTNFLNFAKPRVPRLQNTDLNELLLSVLSLAMHAALDRRVRFTQDQAGESVEVACDPEQLKQVLLNLLLNAVDASPEDSEILIRAIALPHGAAIEVDDAGAGIHGEAAERIFDPFFTTKPKGTGLGLAISSMIVAQHGGRLSFDRNMRGGTTFRVELPAQKEATHAE
jgi:two-component system, NtrC family, sensor histidine kinase HydH